VKVVILLVVEEEQARSKEPQEVMVVMVAAEMDLEEHSLVYQVQHNLIQERMDYLILVVEEVEVIIPPLQEVVLVSSSSHIQFDKYLKT
tara:strand:- start:23 stop:289 length:267 start_codon:yes stop_codon:yes gene_type:complete